MRILFISSNRIGDAVITCGVLDQLIRNQQDCRITIACGSVAQGVFARMPNQERTIIVVKQFAPPTGSDYGGGQTHRGIWLSTFAAPHSRTGPYPQPRRPAPPQAECSTSTGRCSGSPAAAPVVWTAPADRARATTLLPAVDR